MWNKPEKSSRAAFLVDGSNIHATAKNLGFFLDYKKLIDSFDGTVFRACYFTALPPETEQSTLRPMVDYLAYNGWHLYLKEWKEFINDGVPKIKGNMDIEIAVIALEIAPYVTDIFLFSGDGDFTFLVDALQRRHGIRVTVVSSIKTNPVMCADELRRQADAFVEINDLKEHCSRSPASIRRGVREVMGE